MPSAVCDADADRRMKEGPWSVTTRAPQRRGDGHSRLLQRSPILVAGCSKIPRLPTCAVRWPVEPQPFPSPIGMPLNSMCDAVFSLGSAAFLLDNPQYAQRAARVIQNWFINPKTRMNPSLDYAQAIRNVNTGVARGSWMAGRSSAPSRAWSFGTDRLMGSEETRPPSAGGSKSICIGSRRARRHRRKDQRQQSRLLVDRPGGRCRHLRGRRQAAGYGLQGLHRPHLLRVRSRPMARAPHEEARTPLRSPTTPAFNLEALTMTWPRRPGAERQSVGRTRQGQSHPGHGHRLPGTLSGRPQEVEQGTGAEFQNDGLYFLAFAGMGMKKPEYVALFRKLEHSEGAWLSMVDLLVGRWEAAAHQTRH